MLAEKYFPGKQSEQPMNILLACDSPPSSSPAAPPTAEAHPDIFWWTGMSITGKQADNYDRLQAWWNHPGYNNIIVKH